MESESDDDNFDDWSDQDDVSCRSLFDTSGGMVFDSPKACLAHDMRKFSFDVREICSTVGRDDITLIKLVNFVRGRVVEAQADNIPVTPDFGAALQDELIVSHSSLLRDDTLMLPVDREDPLLYLLSDELNDDDDEGSVDLVENNELSDKATFNDDSKEVERLKDQLAKTKALLKHIAEGSYDSSFDPRARSSGRERAKVSKGSVKDDDAHGDNYYFEGYSHLSIHEVMLRDEPRTSTYQAALMKNKDYIKDKVVLDVGCGTGILSIFAAQAGARCVIGVDSSNIIESARQFVARNGFSDRVILIKGRLEEIELPENIDKVDIIISEWMGYALYFENMLSSVLFARDKWLNKSTGLLMPNTANIYVEAMAATGADDRVGYWQDVYGLDMSLLDEGVIREAQVQYVDQKYLASDRFKTHALEISAASDDQLDFVSDFRLVIERDAIINSFVVSFDVVFNGRQMNGETAPRFEDLVLSTGCESALTHWKQTVLWLKPEHCMQCKEGTQVNGRLHYQRSKENPRDYDIVLTWKHKDRDCAQSFRMEA